MALRAHPKTLPFKQLLLFRCRGSAAATATTAHGDTTTTAAAKALTVRAAQADSLKQTSSG